MVDGSQRSFILGMYGCFGYVDVLPNIYGNHVNLFLCSTSNMAHASEH